MIKSIIDQKPKLLSWDNETLHGIKKIVSKFDKYDDVDKYCHVEIYQN